MRDEQDFEQFVVARWATLHRFALLLTGAEAAAQDLMQVTLEKTYVTWPRIASMESPDGVARWSTPRDGSRPDGGWRPESSP